VRLTPDQRLELRLADDARPADRPDAPPELAVVHDAAARPGDFLGELARLLADDDAKAKPAAEKVNS